MRIISDFRDYYDAAQGVARDRSLAYRRSKRTVRLNSPWPVAGVRGRLRGTSNLRVGPPRVVGFCGRLYPVLDLGRAAESAAANCYSLKDADDFIREFFGGDDAEAYFAAGPNAKRWRSARDRRLRQWRDSNRAAVRDWFDAHSELCPAALSGVFSRFGTPLFVASGNSRETVVHCDCSLREYDFVRVKDVYTAFQEISVYLGGMASPEKPIPSVPDDVMAEAKGFDRWSFRKEPREK